MFDRFLRIAYRIAPEPFAEQISQKIWQRECDRRWEAHKAAHIAAGGQHHVLINADGSTSEWLA